ncbi:MAG: Ig-like domain-containing protein [Dysgonamonadaceae bacterium]|jgi:formylmethanofuran dehydrogenase subunit D|nr:Ig-like domain-containing protein [Dysgonamonadaceae bacterium]
MNKIYLFLFSLLISNTMWAIEPQTFFPAKNAVDVDITATTDTLWVVFDTDIPATGTDFSLVIVERSDDPGANLVVKKSGVSTVAVDTENPKKLIIPADLYTYGVTYNVKIPAAAIPGLAADVEWSFTSAKQPITVSAKTPAEGATGILAKATVSFGITPALLAMGESIDASKVTIKDAEGTSISGITVSGGSGFGLGTVTIGHDDFEYGKTYTVTVPTDALNSSSKKFAEDVIWSFSTLATAPTPIVPVTYSPENDAAGVAQNAEISVIFDGPVPTEGTDFSAIKIAVGTGTSFCTGATIDGSNPNRLILSHTALTPGGGIFTVTIPESSIPGLSADVTWQFTLEYLPYPLDNFDPVDGATDVEIQQVIKVRVNHGSNVKLSTTDWSGVTVKAAGDETNYVEDVLITNPSIIARNQTISIYTPTTGLPYGKLITVTIPKTAIGPQYGYELKEDIVWSFTTVNDTGIEIANAGQTSVYPTVTSGMINVKAQGTATVKTLNLQGNLLSQKTFNGNTTIDLSGYASGTYLISIESVSGKSVTKVIKK